MRVLLVESDPGASGLMARAFHDAGDEVVRCHTSQGPAFLCDGLNDHCPLDGAPVDAAVVVRGPERIEPTLREAGARCAINRRVPLVVVGTEHDEPYQRFAVGIVEEDPDTVRDAVAAVVATPSIHHAAVARDAVLSTLQAFGRETTGFDVAVRRDGRRLDAILELDPSLQDVGSRLADRVHAALRTYDHEAAIVDVELIIR